MNLTKEQILIEDLVTLEEKKSNTKKFSIRFLF
jgi:hypothetical protein